jgi:hypothetical protein
MVIKKLERKADEMFQPEESSDTIGWEILYEKSVKK